MKKWFLLLLCCLMMTAPAFAQEDAIVLNAVVEAVDADVLKAPASGELAYFDVRVGDEAAEGDTLFTVEPVKVYAPVDGTISAVFAGAGDIASAAVNRYGAVCYIDYTDRYLLSASSRTGVDNAENRDLRIGQQVYLRSNNEEHFADGFITAYDSASGAVTVQVVGGDLIYNHSVKIYRTPDYDYNSFVGRGNLMPAAPHAVSASGTITDMGVSAGQDVQTGDYLFSYVPDELDPERRGKPGATEAKAEHDWLITAVNVQPGASVQKGQVLLTAIRPGEYELVAQAEEGEVGRIAVDDVFTATFEELDIAPVEAIVTAISPIGTTGGDVSTYTVRLTFTVPEGVYPGMHATLE